MADLDKLIVRIEADLKDLKRGMKEANKQVGSSSQKMQSAFAGVGQTVDRVALRVAKFGSVIGVALGGVALKSFIDVGMTVENLQVRLNALFGSAEEGALAFEKMSEFASKVPFSLDEIQQGSGSLAVVSKDADELAKLLEITGNVASITGLDFRTASEQIQRSFAGGIASADLFRERGVRAMLGFEQGAKVSIEETRLKFEEVFSGNGKFANASDELANTLSGTLSMIGDKFFNFQKTVVDEFFESLKRSIKNLDDALGENEQSIEGFARRLGQSIGDVIKALQTDLESLIETLNIIATTILSILILRGFGKADKVIRGFNKRIKDGLPVIQNLQKELLKIASAIGIADLIISDNTKSILENVKGLEELKKANADQLEGLRLRNAMLRKTINSQKQQTKAVELTKKELEKLEKQLKKNIEAMEEFNKQQLESLELRNKMQNKELLDFFEGLEKAVDRAGESISEAFARAVVKGEDFGQAIKSIFQNLLVEIVRLTIQILVVDKILEAVKEKLNDIKRSAESGTLASLGNAVIGSVGGSFAPSSSVMSSPTFIPSMIGGSGGSGGVTVNQSLNISTGVNQTVRAEIMNMMPDIKQETLGAVAEARSRGGSFARTFGA